VLALDSAAENDPTGLCQRLVTLVALLSETGVPRPLLYAAGQQGLLNPAGNEPGAGPAIVDEALGRLAGASLLTFSVDGTAVAGHRLTLRVARERQARDGTITRFGAGAAELLSAVTDSLAEPWRNRAAARDAVQQILALHEHQAPYLGEHDAALLHRLLDLRAWALWCLNDLGDNLTQAISHGQALVRDSERVLGDTDRSTMIRRNNLAVAYEQAGRLDEAIPLHERNLADREQVLGATDPDTLISRNRLATAYKAAGRVDEAISLHERNLPDCEQILGAAHRDTLTSRNNLAAAYWAAGRLDEAIPLFERTLADCEQVLGAAHPDPGLPQQPRRRLPGRRATGRG
jgi:tetratricopeptide (TPR) repeat protein